MVKSGVRQLWRVAPIALVAVTLLAIAVASASAYVSGGPITGPLRRDGASVADAAGRVIIVHGFNLVHKTAPFTPDTFSAQDARFLASEGFTAARIGLIWQAVEPQPGTYNDAYIKTVAGLNHLLGSYGIRTLIDFHQDGYGAKYGGDGAPDWAGLADSTAPESDELAFQDFWNDAPASDGIGIQTRYVNAWRHVAPFFASSSNPIGYDPFNEPYPGAGYACEDSAPCPQFETGKLADFYTRAIAAIRASDRRHMIWPEGVAQNGIAQPALPKFRDAQTGFNFHLYCLGFIVASIWDQGVDTAEQAGCPSWEQHGIGNFQSYAQGLGVPAMATEFSAADTNTDNARMVDLLDQDFISWTSWSYYTYTQDPASTRDQGLLIDDSKPGSEANAKQPKLDAMVVPYPQAIAGTPLGYSFDRSNNTMTLSYSTAAAGPAPLAKGALTQIFVPKRKYPSGYSVEAQGAKVLSAPTAPWVELLADRGSTRVTVTITPRTGSTTQMPFESQ
jgi:endoglycosylceramidase